MKNAIVKWTVGILVWLALVFALSGVTGCASPKGTRSPLPVPSVAPARESVAAASASVTKASERAAKTKALIEQAQTISGSLSILPTNEVEVRQMQFAALKLALADAHTEIDALTKELVTTQAALAQGDARLARNEVDLNAVRADYADVTRQRNQLVGDVERITASRNRWRGYALKAVFLGIPFGLVAGALLWVFFGAGLKALFAAGRGALKAYTGV